MTKQIEAKIDELCVEVGALRNEVRELRGLIERLQVAAPKAQERADDAVDVAYVMHRTGLAKATILEGKAGTDKITRVSIRPARWQRSSVDAFCRNRAIAKKRGPQPRLVRRKSITKTTT